MSIKTVYECDICGSERRDVNHWFVATPIDDNGLAIFPWASMPNSKDKKAKHLCGQSCVHSYVDRHIGGPNLPVVPLPAPSAAQEGVSYIPLDSSPGSSRFINADEDLPF